MKKKKKFLQYAPLKQDETLDIAVALSQAAALLDKAAAKGLRNDDSELLLEVADRWITIGSLFSGTEESNEHVDTNDSFEQYGFIYEKKDEVTSDDE